MDRGTKISKSILSNRRMCFSNKQIKSHVLWSLKRFNLSIKLTDSPYSDCESSQHESILTLLLTLCNNSNARFSGLRHKCSNTFKKRQFETACRRKYFGRHTSSRECVSMGAAGAQAHRSLGHHLLHPHKSCRGVSLLVQDTIELCFQYV